MKTKSTGKIHIVKATKFIRRMRGGSQACLLQCNDASYYVTKMQGNPQGANVLANEWVGTAMARSVGLRVPDSAMIELSNSFIDNNPDLFFQFTKDNCRPTAGSHFGSALVHVSDKVSRVLDHLTYSQKLRVQDGPAFTGITLHDLLAEQSDIRQMVFSQGINQKTLKPTFIDFGHYCRGPNWERSSPKSAPIKYSISSFPGLWRNESLINGWLSTFQRKLPQALLEAVSSMPNEWYQGNLVEMHAHYQRRIEDFPQIIDFLISRRSAYSVAPSLLNERRAQQ